MADKGSKASQNSKYSKTGGAAVDAIMKESTGRIDSNVGEKVDVPYGNPYTPAKQTEMVKDRVAGGLRELMDLIRSGAEACVDRAAIIEHATNLERQAEKIYDAIEKDAIFVEEVRHHHNRISDLCDNTRAYTQAQMVADLKRAAAIRVNVMTIIQGKAPEYEMEQDELDDLKTVRNMLRRKFGGKKAKKDSGLNDPVEVDQSMMLQNPDSIKVAIPPRSSTEELAAMAGIVPPSDWTAQLF